MPALDFACKGQAWGAESVDCLRAIVRQNIEGGHINGGVEETAQALWAAIHGVTSLLVSNCGFPFVEQTRHRHLERLSQAADASRAGE